MRRIASAKAGATDSTVNLPWACRAALGGVLVQTISITSGSAARRATASLPKMPCVQATRAERAHGPKMLEQFRIEPP